MRDVEPEWTAGGAGVRVRRSVMRVGNPAQSHQALQASIRLLEDLRAKLRMAGLHMRLPNSRIDWPALCRSPPGALHPTIAMCCSASSVETHLGRPQEDERVAHAWSVMRCVAQQAMTPPDWTAKWRSGSSGAGRPRELHAGWVGQQRRSQAVMLRASRQAQAWPGGIVVRRIELRRRNRSSNSKPGPSHAWDRKAKAQRCGKHEAARW